MEISVKSRVNHVVINNSILEILVKKMIHPRNKHGTYKWRFGSNDFSFQLGDLLGFTPAVHFQGFRAPFNTQLAVVS